jgi:signal transduction histidine kinase/CheY-like chemotaxis protein
MDGSSAGSDLGLGVGALETLATAAPGATQRRWAVIACLAWLVITAALIPWATAPARPMPGFIPAYQTLLIGVYALTSYLFFVQYRRARSLSLLILGGGALFTTLIVAVQLLTFPGLFGPGRLLGDSANTTTWLWTLWHLGPPVVAIAYAMAESGRMRFGVAAAPRAETVGPAMVAGWALLAAGACVGLTTAGAAYLPVLVHGDDYTQLTTSGIGPFTVALTLAALCVLAAATRLRTVLQLWLAVSLVLLVADNCLTLAGDARGTVGWLVGRVEALAAAVVVLVVYLREIELLYHRAETTAIEREMARLDLARARDGLAIAMDAAGMGDWDLDIAADSVRRTPRHDQIFGHREPLAHWGRAELLGHILTEDQPGAIAALDRARFQGRLDMECRIRRASDGAVRWIALRGRTSYDASGRPRTMAGIVMDTTERHLADDRAKQSERMEVVGQLTGGVAHDFNNMLTVILGNLDLINRRAGDPAQVVRLSENAARAARRSAEVTDKLLSFSRRQLVRPETVNVNRLLTDLRPKLDRAAGTATVTLDLDPNVVPTTLDPRQFEAAILNLVQNARDAILQNARDAIVQNARDAIDAPGAVAANGMARGAIRIASGNAMMLAADGVRGVPSDLCGASTVPDDVLDGDFVRLTVADTGCGMDAATAAKAFDPFFTTREVGSGAGLGLSQVYGFTRQAQGHVRLDSTPGRGTSVELYLPKAGQAAQGAATATAHGSAPEPDRSSEVVPLRRASSGEVVLVVEDEPTVREAAVESLRDLGYQTLEAADAAAALAMLRTVERIDVLFSDVVMPGGMNGVQLAVEARRLRPRMKVLLTSGYTALTDDRDVPPDVLLLPKPYRRAQLATQLSVVMAG